MSDPGIKISDLKYPDFVDPWTTVASGLLLSPNTWALRIKSDRDLGKRLALVNIAPDIMWSRTMTCKTSINHGTRSGLILQK